MDTQTMKVMALKQALENTPVTNDERRGTVEVTNLNETWKLTCQCYRLTDFSFYLFRKTDAGGWHPSQSISDKEAECFLYGSGLG